MSVYVNFSCLHKVKLGVIEMIVALSIFTEMPSGPKDFESSSSAIKSKISSSVHMYSCGKRVGSRFEG